jgi:hypothetical protein
MCLHYSSEATKHLFWSKKANKAMENGTCAIDIANICEVRTGFATDTFNEVEKKVFNLF